MALFLDHEIVNKLGTDISQLYYLADKETKNDFSAYCRSAKITVTHIMASETLALSNVLYKKGGGRGSVECAVRRLYNSGALAVIFLYKKEERRLPCGTSLFVIFGFYFA